MCDIFRYKDSVEVACVIRWKSCLPVRIESETAACCSRCLTYRYRFQSICSYTGCSCMRVPAESGTQYDLVYEASVTRYFVPGYRVRNKMAPLYVCTRG